LECQELLVNLKRETADRFDHCRNNGNNKLGLCHLGGQSFLEGFSMLNKAGKSLIVALSLALTALMSGAARTQAQVIREDQAAIKQESPVYCWRDASIRPRAIAIAVHGLTMHGGTFDTMARRLAANGVIVYAPDLRGYGRWMPDKNGNQRYKEASVDYESSYSDLVSLVKSAKQQYPDLPMFCIGESLGTAMALRAASEMPDAFQGIVLSSPAVKLHAFIWSKLEMSGPIMVNPNRQMDLVKYIKKFASEDPQIVAGALNDPLVRKRLSILDLYHTVTTCRPVLDYAKRVPEKVSVLVIQGGDDRMVQSKAVIRLISELKSTDQTVRWFHDRGHVLLETDFVRPDTLATVAQWVCERVHKVEVARINPSSNDFSEVATIASRR
jgi:alpha-beta hydrolase superfamily lysophospholipase